MPQGQLHAAICWSLLVFAMTPWSSAFQDAPAPPGGKELTQNTLDYAAIVTFREMMKSQSFAVPEDKVRAVVLAWLRRDTSPFPKSMPAVEQLQGDLDSDFEAAWTEIIDQAAAEQDPNGKLGIAKRLRDSLEHNPSLRNEAKTKHNDLLKNEMPKALERVKGALVKEQEKQLIEALKSVVSSDMPGQQQVVNALSGDLTQARQILTDEVLRNSPEELHAILIVESFQTLSDAADNVVSDGVTQLKQQLQSLETQPTAISRPAIQKEFENLLQKLADSQQAQRVGDALRPGYGVFSRVNEEISGNARRWFDQQVASAGARIWEEVALKKRQIPSEDETTLRELILADLPAHHQPAASWRAAQLVIQEMVNRGQQWIEDDLVKALPRSKSPDDREYSADLFRQDIVEIVGTDGTQGHSSWSKLQEVLLKRYKNELLPAIRMEIAGQQARQYAPQLMNQNWTPTETDLTSIPKQLQPGTLADLAVWRNGPPQSTDKVLQETWELWIKAVQEALAVAQQALDGQLQIVGELRPSILEQIRQDAEPTHDKWVKEFSRQTTQAWQTRGGTVAERYPELFSTTDAKIVQIVTELLPLVEKEKPKKQSADPERKEEPQQPAVPDHSAMPKPDTEPLPSAGPRAKEPDATGSPDGQGGTGGSESKGNSDDPANSSGVDGSAESGDGETGNGGEENNEEPGAEEAKGGEGEGEGQGKGEGEGLGKKELPPGEVGEEEFWRVPADRIAPEPRSFADWFYRIAFWVLLFVIFVMAVCWYFHVRYLRRLLAQYRRAVPSNKR